MTSKLTLKQKLINKLLKKFPHVKDVTSEKHKSKGTFILFNEKTNRRYYIYKSGFAKAVSGSGFHCETDFINAWACNWVRCHAMIDSELIKVLSSYIEYFDNWPRDFTMMYGRRAYKLCIYNEILDKYYPDTEIY